MDEAEYCDRIALVYHGRVIDIGSPDDLKDGVRGPDLADPSLEDAFVALIAKDDQAKAGGKAAWSPGRGRTPSPLPGSFLPDVA